MTWEVACFLVVGMVILAGFAWYERSRPPAQVVALVAALAALAIAGRIAFAAFPNVKPTTDIVIFAGYALGGAPGFAVGALAALVSNFWFGQGPWTPWQMAGWGLCGVLGAALAVGTRNAGRLALAATCGFAGIFYGALMNFSLMATYGGDLSWRHFLVLEGRAIPFEIAHVLGNVVLALVAGPAMVRMLVRFRRRFEWERGAPDVAPPRRQGPLGGALRSGGVAAFLLVALVALAPAPAHAASVTEAADWLESVQNGDGGFGPSASDESGTATTCWVMLGLEAAGRNPLDVTSTKGRTPVDFLRKEIGAIGSPGDLARTILALEGAGVDSRNFADRNLVSELLASRRDNGSYHGWPNSTAFAVIALRAAGVEGVQKSLDWLRKVQNEDGGWGDTPGSPSTTDGTGAVLQALSPDSKAAGHGLFYLRHKGAEEGRRLPDRRQRHRQHDVDGLGDPGDPRRRRQSRFLPSRQRQRPRVSRPQPARERLLPVRQPRPDRLRGRQPDAGLGDGAGAGRCRRQVLPDRRAAAFAEAEAAESEDERLQPGRRLVGPRTASVELRVCPLGLGPEEILRWGPQRVFGQTGCPGWGLCPWRRR